MANCKDILAINNDGNIIDFNGANATDSFNFKTKITGQTNDNRVINVEIMVGFIKIRKHFLENS